MTKYHLLKTKTSQITIIVSVCDIEIFHRCTLNDRFYTTVVCCVPMICVSEQTITDVPNLGMDPALGGAVLIRINKSSIRQASRFIPANIEKESGSCFKNIQQNCVCACAHITKYTQTHMGIFWKLTIAFKLGRIIIIYFNRNASEWPSVSASHTVGHGFTSRSGHTKDHHQYGTDSLPLLHEGIRVEVDGATRLCKRPSQKWYKLPPYLARRR